MHLPTKIQLAPLGRGPRLPHLDVMRGIAILSILFLNISSMGTSIWREFDDFKSLGWTVTDQIIWWWHVLFIGGTARGVLELLFGCGLIILTDRFAATMSELDVIRTYGSRNLVLFVFGIAHVFLILWPGDILHVYAVASLFVVVLRRLPARAMLFVGLLWGVGTLFHGVSDFARERAHRAEMVRVEAATVRGAPLSAEDHSLLLEIRQRGIAEAKAKADALHDYTVEDRERTGTLLTWAHSAWTAYYRFLTSFEILVLVEAAATMLIGAALFKLGVLQGERSARFYLALVIFTYAIGFSLRTMRALDSVHAAPGPRLSEAFYDVARIAMTIGHVGLINLLLMTRRGAAMLSPFAAVGRIALSVYLAESILCIWLIYSPIGFGLYGQHGWTELTMVAFIVDVVLILVANVYVRYFELGPVEWLWRSLSERRRLPIRLTAREKGDQVTLVI